MAEIAERTANLKAWERQHDEQEHKLVKDQLARMADADTKNAQLANIYLEANELTNKRDALEHLAKLKTAVKMGVQIKKAQDQKQDPPLPIVPKEYEAPKVNGREVI